MRRILRIETQAGDFIEVPLFDNLKSDNSEIAERFNALFCEVAKDHVCSTVENTI